MEPHSRPIDEIAAGMPWMASMAPCLHIPVGVRNRDAIEHFVGSVIHEFKSVNDTPMFVVSLHNVDSVDLRLPVWQLAAAAQLHAKVQVWVHIDSRRYRHAFREAFPDVDLRGKDVDHVMNRDIARLKGFDFVRLIAISRAANRSSGSVSEKWGIAEQRKSTRRSDARVQYADIADIVKMLDIKTGGGVMDAVNEAQALFEVPKPL